MPGRLAHRRGAAQNVRFQVHNLLEMPPHPGDFDIVLCRNVLLYLCAEKALAFDRLASAMADDGYFMLGAGETVIGQTKKLVADPKARGCIASTIATSPTAGPAKNAEHQQG